MVCQTCGNAVPPQDRTCRACGSPVRKIDAHHGGVIFWLSFFFIGLLPVTLVLLEFIVEGLSDNFHARHMLDLLAAGILLGLFYVALLGHTWAIRALGWFLAGGNLIVVIIYGTAYSSTFFADLRITLGLLYLAWGAELIRSKDVYAYIDRRTVEPG